MNMSEEPLRRPKSSWLIPAPSSPGQQLSSVLPGTQPEASLAELQESSAPLESSWQSSGDWEHTLPKALEQLFGGKAALSGRDTHEPVGWKRTLEQERGSTSPKDLCWAQLQLCSARREEPRVSVLASTCLGCSENPMHQTAKYLW